MHGDQGLPEVDEFNLGSAVTSCVTLEQAIPLIVIAVTAEFGLQSEQP